MRNITKSFLAAAFVTATVAGGIAAASDSHATSGAGITGGTVIVTPDTGWPGDE